MQLIWCWTKSFFICVLTFTLQKNIHWTRWEQQRGAEMTAAVLDELNDRLTCCKCSQRSNGSGLHDNCNAWTETHLVIQNVSTLHAFINLNDNLIVVDELKFEKTKFYYYLWQSEKKRTKSSKKLCKSTYLFLSAILSSTFVFGLSNAIGIWRCECVSVYACMWLCLCTRAYDMRCVCVSVVIVCFGNQSNKNTEFSTLELVLRSWCVYTLYQIHQQT